jgi:hypothetical protein
MNLTYEQFRARLCEEMSKTKGDTFTPWMIEVGYRPDDKDMGFRRWQELTGSTPKETQSTFLESFQSNL